MRGVEAAARDAWGALGAAVALCQRNSSRLPPAECEQLWFDLLERCLRPLHTAATAARFLSPAGRPHPQPNLRIHLGGRALQQSGPMLSPSFLSPSVVHRSAKRQSHVCRHGVGDRGAEEA